MNNLNSTIDKITHVDILETYSEFECPNIVSYTRAREDHFMGIQFSVTSSALTKLLKPFKLKKVKSSNKENTFGDDFWMFVFEPIAIDMPKTLDEFKTWLLGYFEIFGTDFFINNDKDENLERIPVNKRKRIAKVVTNNIDNIMETLESFNVSAITYNYRTEDIETERITYTNNEIIESEIEEEEVDQFMKDFDIEISIGAWV